MTTSSGVRTHFPFGFVQPPLAVFGDASIETSGGDRVCFVATLGVMVCFVGTFDVMASASNSGFSVYLRLKKGFATFSCRVKGATYNGVGPGGMSDAISLKRPGAVLTVTPWLIGSENDESFLAAVAVDVSRLVARSPTAEETLLAEDPPTIGINPA